MKRNVAQGAPFRCEFPLRLQVQANGSQGNRYGRASMRADENEIVWWELKDGGLEEWRRLHPGFLVVRLTRLAPFELDTGNLWFALKGVQDVVAAVLGLKSDREGAGASWTVHQEKTKFQKIMGVRTGDYRVRVEVDVKPEQGGA